VKKDFEGVVSGDAVVVIVIVVKEETARIACLYREDVFEWPKIVRAA
jgi:hypothetical protein